MSVIFFFQAAARLKSILHIGDMWTYSRHNPPTFEITRKTIPISL